MGTTPTFGLPYPDGTDLVVQGDDAIQALAEAIEARWAPAVAQINLANNGSTIGGSLTTVAFPGTVAFMEDFSYSAGVLTYLGPLRLFNVSTSVAISIPAAGANSLVSQIQLWQSGVSIEQAELRVDTASGGVLAATYHTHRIATPTQLSAGDTLQVRAASSPNGVCGSVSLRVFPIGPALS